MYKQVSFSFYDETLSAKDNPHKVGIICIAAGILIALIIGVSASYSAGFIDIPTWAFLAGVSIFSGALMAAIMLCFSVPVFISALGSARTKATITEAAEQEVSVNPLRPGKVTMYTPLLEYDFDGRHYSRASTKSFSSIGPEAGKTITILVNKEHPDRIMFPGKVGFYIFATIIFAIAGIIFALPGIKISQARNIHFSPNVQVSVIEPGTQEGKEFALVALAIGGGFALLFCGIGTGLCIAASNRQNKTRILESGIKHECTITEVRINEGVVINRENPIQRFCTDTDRRIFTVKTKGLPDDYIQGQKIDIYTDPEDPERFVTDFDSLKK